MLWPSPELLESLRLDPYYKLRFQPVIIGHCGTPCGRASQPAQLLRYNSLGYDSHIYINYPMLPIPFLNRTFLGLHNLTSPLNLGRCCLVVEGHFTHGVIGVGLQSWKMAFSTGQTSCFEFRRLTTKKVCARAWGFEGRRQKKEKMAVNLSKTRTAQLFR